MARAPAAVAASLALALSPEAGGQPPSYRTDTAAIKVDVVVLDAGGQPVRGLEPRDFTVLEDGRPQTITAFEARDLEAGPAAPATPEGPTGATTNTGPAARADRTLALLVDDLGISPAVALELRARLASWISARARPTDEITIMATSGSVWWSDVVATGRDDLLAALSRLQGRMVESGGGETMTAAEAYRIDVNEANREYAAGSAARSRPADALPAPGGSMTLVGSSVTERVAQRWLDTQVCPPCSSPYESGSIDCTEIRQCFQRVALRARELHASSARREAILLQAVSRLSRSLAAAEGRKSILILSEALVNDASLGRALPDAIDAAQRSNTALYFVDARGLAGSPFTSAAAGSALSRSQDMGAMNAEETVLATGGGESLAAETGGTLTRSNDLALGLERMADDASSYYLLGYQPQKPLDGRWHKLDVRVAREHVTVRARRGYRATEEAPPAPAPKASKPKAKDAIQASPLAQAAVGKRPLDPTLLAGAARGRLPLRLATYVMEPERQDLVRVDVVLEIDNGRVAVDRSTVPWKAALDLTIVAAGVARPATIPVDERLTLTLGPNDVGNGWWLVRRDVGLPRGLSQIRVLVRDVSTGMAGLVTQRVSVPDFDHPYVSTPLLSDRTLPPEHAGEPPRLVPTARRVFGDRDTLYCQYEVFGFGGQGLAGVPQLFGAYRLEASDGRLASEEGPRGIETDGIRAVRRLALPLGQLASGAYVLVVSIQDRLAGQTASARTSFEVKRPEALPERH